MIEFTLKGSHYEIGQEIGKLIRKAGYSPPILPPERVKLAEECEKLVQKHTESGEIGSPTKTAVIDEEALAKIAASQKIGEGFVVWAV